MSVKRLTNELGTNYYVIKYDILRDGFEIPKIIRSNTTFMYSNCHISRDTLCNKNNENKKL